MTFAMFSNFMTIMTYVPLFIFSAYIKSLLLLFFLVDVTLIVTIKTVVQIVKCFYNFYVRLSVPCYN